MSQPDNKTITVRAFCSIIVFYPKSNLEIKINKSLKNLFVCCNQLLSVYVILFQCHFLKKSFRTYILLNNYVTAAGSISLPHFYRFRLVLKRRVCDIQDPRGCVKSCDNCFKVKMKTGRIHLDIFFFNCVILSMEMVKSR